MGFRQVAHGVSALVSAALFLLAASASAHAGPTAKQYVSSAGGRAKIVASGKLVLAGRRMICGRRPTVLDPNFIDFGGAYPGFLILNMRKIKRLPRAVQFYVFAHECGHQFRGQDEEAADCFAVKRGRRQGWLSPAGLKQICKFMSPLTGDTMHATGTERCQLMRQCYKNARSRRRANR